MIIFHGIIFYKALSKQVIEIKCLGGD